jgi:uncharacterized membrane protein YheB (UPF0754 family)
MPFRLGGKLAAFPRLKREKAANDYYSKTELRQKLLCLTNAEYKRLLSTAEQQAVWSKVQPSDLVNEAITRLLQPSGRRWSKRYTFEQLLFGIVTSIGSEIREKEVTRTKLEAAFVELVEIQDDDVLDFLHKEEVIEEIMKALEHEPIARAMVEHLAAGRSRSEIQQMLSMSYDDYRNTRKRIVRHFQQRVRK